jgi:hypothetical protein
LPSGKTQAVKPGTTFVMGLLIGVSAGVLLKRLQVIFEEEKPERVFDRLNDSLDELERRAQLLETRISPN